LLASWSQDHSNKYFSSSFDGLSSAPSHLVFFLNAPRFVPRLEHLESCLSNCSEKSGQGAYLPALVDHWPKERVVLIAGACELAGLHIAAADQEDGIGQLSA